MNWINSVVRPKITSFLSKREVPDNLWIKCPESGEMVFHRDLEANHWVVPGSGFHMRMPQRDRLVHVFGGDSFEELPLPEVPADPLKFRDERRYSERLKDARIKTGRDDCVTVARGEIEDVPAIVAVQDFQFLGGSLGMAAGEALIAGLEAARTERRPFVLFTASGGARMQEGILSLMQMPRTTAAVSALKEAGLPYIVVLTNPTTGGVTASYAMLGDIHMAEPGALIGFAGPRVIEQTIREKLPSGFQRAEYLLEHGMIDLVVARRDLPATLARVLRTLLHMPSSREVARSEPAVADRAVTAADTVSTPAAAAEAAESLPVAAASIPDPATARTDADAGEPVPAGPGLPYPASA